MRMIDDTLGNYICGFIGIILRIVKIFFAKTSANPKEVKNILLQKYFGMGSILNILPLVKGLRKQYPKAKITLLTLESNREVALFCKIADEVIIIRVDFINRFVMDVFRSVTYFLRNSIDISIDLEFFSKFSMLVSVFSMAHIRVGLYQKKIRPEGIMTHNIYYNHYKHLSKIYFAFAYALGIKFEAEYFSSLLPTFKKCDRDSLKRKLGLNKNAPIITINVNASDLFVFRRWPDTHFVEIIQLLIQKYPNYSYVLIGGEKDYQYVERVFYMVQNNTGQLCNCAGKTNIQELFALVEMSYLMITNDSGPLHIASLYGINIAAFFGPETPLVYGPLQSNALIFYSDDVYCSPCMNVYDSKKSSYGEFCKENICLMNIKPKQVFEKIEKCFLKG